MAGTNFAVSPDGRSLAFVSRTRASEPWFLFVRPIGSVAPQKLAAAEDATQHSVQPFWSPTAAHSVRDRRKLRRSSFGRAAQDICNAAGFTGGTWNREGTILFGSAAGLFAFRPKAESRKRLLRWIGRVGTLLAALSA